MRDHKLTDIAREIHKELPKGVPYVVVYWVCRFFLRKMYKVIGMKHARIMINKNAAINNIYKDYDIKAITAKQISDLDETHEAQTPSIVLRSKINPKRVHYPRLGPNPIYKRKSG